MPYYPPAAGFGTMDIEHVVGATGEPAFTNSWANMGAPFRTLVFRKDPFGRVLITGSITNGTNASAIFTLPAGYRPPSTIYDITLGASGVAGNFIDVQPDGQVIGTRVGTDLHIDMTFDTDSVTAYSAAPGGAATLAYAEITGNVTVSAVTEGAATTIVTAPAFTADGIQSYWIEFYAPSVTPASASNGQIDFVIYESGASIGGIFGQVNTPAAAILAEPILIRRKVTPAAGARTYSIRAYQVNGNGTVSAGAGGSGVLGPAYVRISPENNSGPQGSAGPGSLTPRAASAAYSPVSGDLVMMTGSFTVTLPTPIAGRLVGVISVNGSGTAPCTVSTPSGAILGKGVVASATTIKLGTTAATAIFEADGTNWNIVAGEQDTGWIALPCIGTFVSHSGVPCYYRKIGCRVICKGLITGSGSGPPFSLATLPTGFRPSPDAVYTTMEGTYAGGFLAFLTVIDTAGLIVVYDSSGVNINGTWMSVANIDFMID